MNAENVKSQMRKGTLEYCILLLLKKEPAYTSDIIQKLQEAKLIVVEGTLYPLFGDVRIRKLPLPYGTYGSEWREPCPELSPARFSRLPSRAGFRTACRKSERILDGA